MFRIRRIDDALLPIDQLAIEQVQGIVASHFDDVSSAAIRRIPEQLRDPIKYDFRTLLFVCDDRRGKVHGFALFSVEHDLRFGFLDLLAIAPGRPGGGVGSSLYERIREECRALRLDWLLLECLTEQSIPGADATRRRQDRARLRFYERQGARPLLGTLWERPRAANAENAYYLLVDDLDREAPLAREPARAMARAILQRKYRGQLRPRELSEILGSFQEDPLRLRPPREKRASSPTAPRGLPVDRRIVLCVSDRHEMHHVKDRGYAELPVRVQSILEAIEPTGLFERIPRRRFGERYLRAVHDPAFLRWFRSVARSIDAERPLFPDVFPIRRTVGSPRPVPTHAGYYCIDIYSPIYDKAWEAARDAVDAALSAGRAIEEGARLAYALVRPPGHHAGRDSFGGYCYFNSTAIAAQEFSRLGRVAILDLDYHHGNGQQEIFYRRGDVLTVSIHGDPAFEYPYFSGYSKESGHGEGLGANLNLPLPAGIGGELFGKALEKALRKVKEFHPAFLVLALGLDTARNDPSGTWQLEENDFRESGQRVGELGLRTLVVQEGGYDCAVLGRNARAFLSGLWEGAHKEVLRERQPD